MKLFKYKPCFYSSTLLIKAMVIYADVNGATNGATDLLDLLLEWIYIVSIIILIQNVT